MRPNPSDAFGLLLAVAASNPDVAALGFATIEFAPALETRGPLSSIDAFAVARALELREKLHLPFWDGVMLAASSDRSKPAGALKAATYHQSLRGKVEWVSTEKLSIQQLESMSRKA